MTYQPKTPIACSICGKKAVARKLCKPCYYKQRRRGLLDAHQLLQPDDVFEDRILKTDGCWIWKGNTNQYGYGIFLLPGEKPVRAHRYAYEKWKGPLDADKVVMHTCDNPVCVNPSHLSVGTKLDNNRDAKSKLRHAFGEKNGHARLTTKQVQSIREDARPQYVLAAQYGVCQSHISRIKSNQARQLG